MKIDEGSGADRRRASGRGPGTASRRQPPRDVGGFKRFHAVGSGMKIRQNLRHWAAKKALTTPVIGPRVNDRLVDMHTDIFLGKTDESNHDARRAHLDDFFDATMDTYVAALQGGYPEAEAREITHIQANFDFFTHGWTEMMEIPADELEDHYRRYEEFFAEYDITIDDPLGEFAPATGVTAAPTTLENLEGAEYENAIEGFADDVYVETPEGLLKGRGTDEPDVSPTEAPGADAEDDEASAD
jgi:hypothetical protein